MHRKIAIFIATIQHKETSLFNKESPFDKTVYGKSSETSGFPSTLNSCYKAVIILERKDCSRL